MSKMKAEAEKQPKITVERDDFLATHGKWAGAEKDAASDAGERRQAIGAYAEAKGLENKAMSQIRAGLKIKNEGKRKDWLRSVEALLPIARAEIFGNQPDLPIGEEDTVVPIDGDAA